MCASKMAAAGAFDCVRGVIFRHQQNLHFAHFERPQHPPQAGHAAAVALGLAEDFTHLLMPVLSQRLSQHAFALLSHLLFGDLAHVGGEAPQQPLLT